MIELHSNTLAVSFHDLPEHPRLTIDFQRTLRIPDDGKDIRSRPVSDRSPCGTLMISRSACPRAGSSAVACCYPCGRPRRSG